jgi:hypothetical protein
MVSWLTSRFRAPQPQQKKGAPIASYSMGNDPTGLGGNARGDVNTGRVGLSRRYLRWSGEATVGAGATI